MVKAYNLSIDYVLYDMSYANILLYGAVLPSFDNEKTEVGESEEVIDADDPANREKVRKILLGD